MNDKEIQYRLKTPMQNFLYRKQLDRTMPTGELHNTTSPKQCLPDQV